MARDVLVVEDERDIRRLVVLHLERDGFRCRTATNGPDALREAKTAVPDLVVLDLMLPELDGLEVCRRLRSDTSTAAVPIIMLTAKSDEVDRVVGLEVGADDYVGKPFSPKELVARVRAVLRRSRPHQAPRVLSAGPPPPGPAPPPPAPPPRGGGVPPHAVAPPPALPRAAGRGPPPPAPPA